MQEHFSRICKRAGVRYGRRYGGLFHKLRRTSGTLVEQAGADGSRHIGNTRAVFERRYRDPRFMSRVALELLPRPAVPRAVALLTDETASGGNGSK